MELKLKISEQDLTIQSLITDIGRLKGLEQDLLSSEETTAHQNNTITEKDKRIEQLRSNIIQLEILLSDARNWESQYIKTHELLINTEGQLEIEKEKVEEIEKEKELLIQRGGELQLGMNSEAEERAKAVEEIIKLQEKVNELQKQLMREQAQQSHIVMVEQNEQMVQTTKDQQSEEIQSLLSSQINNKDKLIKHQEEVIQKLNKSIEDILIQCKENIQKNQELQQKIEQINEEKEEFDALLVDKENEVQQFQKSLEFAEHVSEEKQSQISSLTQLLKQKIEFSNEQELKIKEMTMNMQQMAFQINELEKILKENQEVFDKNNYLEENIRVVYEQLERSQKLNTEQQEIILEKIEKEKINNKEIMKLSSLMKSNDKSNSANKFECETPKHSSYEEYERQIALLTNQIEPLLNEIELWKQKYKEFEQTCTEALSQSQTTLNLQQSLDQTEKELQFLYENQSSERMKMFLLCVEVDALRRRLNFTSSQKK